MKTFKGLQENNVSKFIQYLRDNGLSSLLESIGPVKTDFGSDLKNNEWVDIIDVVKTKKNPMSSSRKQLMFTFTQIDNYFYQIYLINNSTWYELGFATSRKFDSSNPLSKENVESFDKNRTNDARIFSVFNRVFYISLEGLKKFNIDRVAFQGADIGLGKLYSRMMKQKSLQAILSQYGYKYIEENKDVYFLFTKKD